MFKSVANVLNQGTNVFKCLALKTRKALYHDFPSCFCALRTEAAHEKRTRCA